MRSATVLDPDPQDLAVMRGYPTVPWTVALVVHGELGGSGLACRICIARHGLGGRNIGGLRRTEGEHVAHLQTFHHLQVS